MIYNYKEMLDLYGSAYQVCEAVKKNQVYKIEKGIYSDKEFVDYLLVINKKYPNAIFTLDSAYYYHNLTDVIPEKYFLATDRDSSKINNDKIHQVFVSSKFLDIGVSNLKVNGIEIKIYDKERILIELMRMRKRLPFDYYKEIINNYRKIVNSLDMEKLEYYLSFYKNHESLFDTIQREVF